MSHPLRALGRSSLAGLAEALATGRLGAPITKTALGSHVPEEHLEAVSAALAETPATVLLREFATHIRDQVWPGKRLPEVFYDPRSLAMEGPKRAVLHAKAVVVDGRFSLLTSANFTEAAQERNIEAGVLMDDMRLAARVTQQFDHFVERRILQRLKG